MKIFINIASYRDPMLENTVIDAYENAKYKDSLIFSVVDQGHPNETICLDRLPFKQQIRYLRIDPHYARGACWARNLAQSQFNGEDYYFQIDSHSLFDADWDERFLKNYEELKQYHSQPLISNGVNIFDIEDLATKKFKKTKYVDVIAQTLNIAHCFVNNDYYVAVTPVITTLSTIVPGFLVAAGCIFTDGSFVEQVPYDPFLFFNGEEQSLALRAWTSGYDIFHIPDVPVYHNFSPTYRPLIWGDVDTQNQALIKWWEYEANAKQRLRGIVTGANLGKYGIGSTRSLDDYKKWSGIDYHTRTVNLVNVFDKDYRSAVRF